MSEKIPSDIWAKLLAELGEEIQNDLYLHSTKPIVISDTELTVSVPDEFTYERIEERYRARMDKILHLINPNLTLTFIVANEAKIARKTSPEALESTENLPEATNLNPKYTFEKFVVGPNNRWAHAAASSVAENPNGVTYNPLFIYGGVGLGKTHLLHAIGNYVRERQEQLKVLYVSSETFMNDLLEALRRSSYSSDFRSDFRNKYRTKDILMIDDIQFLQRGPETQEEFFHTFNVLYQANKQIVITSDSPPQKIPSLEERLVSRFEAGLVVNLAPPEKETRVAILQQKSADQNFDLPIDVAFFIAEVVQTNIRELEGALTKIISYAGLHKIGVTVDLARDVLNAVPRPSNELYKMISVDDIQKAVVAYFPSISMSDLRSPRRNKAVVIPRQIAMYLCKQLTNMSLMDIGTRFGGRDHTTVIHACNKVEEAIRSDREFDITIKQLMENIKK
ncbi:chromosomal replication initiator protein DnaA [Candidatus Poribacteria bacterium]|nr:chromosomal replication initiator protein DnaA [Candidatus Poribacteria bacterium]